MNRRGILTKALGFLGIGTAAQAMVLPELLTGDIHFIFGEVEGVAATHFGMVYLHNGECITSVVGELGHIEWEKMYQLMFARVIKTVQNKYAFRPENVHFIWGSSKENLAENEFKLINKKTRQ